MTPAPRKILAFRNGQLGDMLVALPALRILRDAYPGATLTLLSDRHPERSFVPCKAVFEDLEILDDYILVPYYISPWRRLMRPLIFAWLIAKIRLQGIKVAAYLVQSPRLKKKLKRDYLFFKACGIQTVLGMDDFPAPSDERSARPLPMVNREADALVDRLRASGVSCPPSPLPQNLLMPNCNMPEFERWQKSAVNKANSAYIAVCPGSKMSAKIWPKDRYIECVRSLMSNHDLYPIVLGGSEDAALGDEMIRAWGKGANAAGQLSLAGSAAALKSCVLYLGNDTGVMHLAAGVGTPCVAIFSARDVPGLWYPYGQQHRVFRSAIDCEGCMLFTCTERKMECLTQIKVAEVVSACEEILAERRRAAS